VLHLVPMRNLFIILILALLSCDGNKPLADLAIEEDVLETNFDWLLGDWKRVNDEGEKMTFESWEKTDHSTYSGIGYTLLFADTVWQEEMRLVKTDEGWNFEVFLKGSLHRLSLD